MTSIMIRRYSSFAFAVIGASFAAGCTTAEPAPSPPVVVDGPLQLLHADVDRGIAAIYDDGVERLELRAWLDPQGLVHSIVTDHGRLVTRFEIPYADDAAAVAAEIGPRARAIAWDQAFAEPTADDQARWLQLMPVYERALTSLYQHTDNLGESSLRMALPWNEEVLARIVVGSAFDSDVDDACLGEAGPPHTNLLHRPAMTVLRKQAAQEHGNGAETAGGVAANEAACDLHCSWYDICCQHDEACVACDHWWCGWSCEKGCFGGDCGGGR